MNKKLLERPVFCKEPTYVTFICNHKEAIRAYSRNWKNKVSILSSI